MVPGGKTSPLAPWGPSRPTARSRALPSTTSAWMVSLVQVGEYDLDGPLRDLVTVVLAMGEEI